MRWVYLPLSIFSREGNSLQTVLTVLHVLLCIALISVILLQSGKSAGLSGSIAGGAETLLGKKKGLDDFLGRITVVVGLLFGVLSLALAVMNQ